MSNTYYKVNIAHSHKPSYSWELFPALLRLVTVSRLPTFYSAIERLRSTPCKPETGKSSLCSFLLSCYTLNKTCHTHTTYITICITVLVDVGTWSHTDISWFGRICSWKTLYKVQEYPSSHLRACREEPVLAGLSPSLDALPLRMAEFVTIPGCIGAVDTRVPSRTNSAPVGIPRWRRVLVRRSLSRDIGLGDSATIKMYKTNINIQWSTLIQVLLQELVRVNYNLRVCPAYNGPIPRLPHILSKQYCT